MCELCLDVRLITGVVAKLEKGRIPKTISRAITSDYLVDYRACIFNTTHPLK